MGITPQDYQESVKAKEFVTFLRMHGVEVGETETSSPSRQADPNDCVQVLKKLHIGVQLLLSTSKRPSKVDIRQRFEELIMKQAAWFLGGDLDRVQDANHQIQSILQEEVKQEERVQQSHNNMEIDLYMHGWSKTGLLPAAIAFSFTNLAGISYTITPLNPTPQPRDPVSIDSSLQVTPLAKRKTNVVNVGEVATSKGNLLKKIAQLERAATYALVRATNQTEDVLQVVGYGSLGMMTDAAHFARTIISLHPDMFPCLTSLQSKGALAYLHSDRSVFKDIETIAESIGNIKSEIHVMKCLFFAFGVAMVAMSFGVAMVAMSFLKRH